MLSKIIKDFTDIPKTLGYKLQHHMAILADEEEACQDPCWAYWFAKDVPGANIEKCQESACRDSYYAYMFAKYIPGANIEKCQEVVCKNSYWTSWFARDVPGANIEKCRAICKGTKYAF